MSNEDLAKKDVERLLYIYKRALVMLSKVTEKEVRDHLTSSTYEEYVQGVAKKHLELAKPYEENMQEEMNIDDIFEEWNENDNIKE